MQHDTVTLSSAPRHTPWNKGKLIGAKPPLRPKHVWSIRTRLLVEGRTRDLAMFNLAIDSKLRGCDVVRPASGCPIATPTRRRARFCGAIGPQYVPSARSNRNARRGRRDALQDGSEHLLDAVQRRLDANPQAMRQ